MQINACPPMRGREWVYAGYRLFKKQPLTLIGIVAFYWTGWAIALVIPFVGVAAASVWQPFGLVALMSACRLVSTDRVATPMVFADVFQDPAARIGLFRLGAINAGLQMLLIIASSLILGDPPSHPRPSATSQQPDLDSLFEHMSWSGVGAMALLYLPVIMSFWFAPVLVAWHRQSPAKAMFASFIACWRNRWALLVYILTLSLASTAGLISLIQVFGWLGVPASIIQFLIAPAFALIFSVMTTSQWPIYLDVIDDKL